ncbi:hypothetical protein N1031_00695 [Herbiconiux moechotypicola]|uniref:WxL domain-containing protein n=1 Tax=Herbiconiux moechotypicola TaxID=637393 RepID=A0ABN3D8H0_9MICO|nr:hypothetical protein [Herbiconiux moechotypicola]MCS5728269.1 hypothetical protein [Herbiconiux moechotypicola]
MFKKTAARVLAAGVVAAALVATSAVAASAATPAGTAGPFYLIDSADGTAIAPGTTIDWEFDVSGNPTESNEAFDQVFTGPSDATGVIPFITTRGTELTPGSYSAKAFGDFSDPVAKTVLMSPAKLSSFTEGMLGANGVRAAGGEYSLGFAFVKDNGVSVASDAVYFTYISVTAGTGAWTFETPSGTDPEPEPGENEFEIDLNATTMNAPQGDLSLIAPASTTATIGSPTLVDGLSTSTGKLGQFTVSDERYQSHEGWTLTTSVTDFTKSDDPTKVIQATQLAIAPEFVGTPNANVTLAAAHAASSAPAGVLFAQSNNTEAAGDVTLDAGLTFVAPGSMPAGTYTSKMTVTLASK